MYYVFPFIIKIPTNFLIIYAYLPYYLINNLKDTLLVKYPVQ